jgi:DNA-binding PadR family transcriptional regulator
MVPFGATSHTQIYPALASLLQQGLVRYHIVEQHSGRPNKKVYELTGEGHAALQQWVESPTAPAIFPDEFFLKAFSLWLADPERTSERFREQVQLHQRQLAHYERALQSQQLVGRAGPENADVLGLNEALLRYVLGYERNYVAWCQSMIQYLEQRLPQPSQEEEQA